MSQGIMEAFFEGVMLKLYPRMSSKGWGELNKENVMQK